MGNEACCASRGRDPDEVLLKMVHARKGRRMTRDSPGCSSDPPDLPDPGSVVFEGLKVVPRYWTVYDNRRSQTELNAALLVWKGVLVEISRLNAKEESKAPRVKELFDIFTKEDNDGDNLLNWTSGEVRQFVRNAFRKRNLAAPPMSKSVWFMMYCEHACDDGRVRFDFQSSTAFLVQVAESLSLLVSGVGIPVEIEPQVFIMCRMTSRSSKDAQAIEEGKAVEEVIAKLQDGDLDAGTSMREPEPESCIPQPTYDRGKDTRKNAASDEKEEKLASGSSPWKKSRYPGESKFLVHADRWARHRRSADDCMAAASWPLATAVALRSQSESDSSTSQVQEAPHGDTTLITLDSALDHVLDLCRVCGDQEQSNHAQASYDRDGTITDAWDPFADPADHARAPKPGKPEKDRLEAATSAKENADVKSSPSKLQETYYRKRCEQDELLKEKAAEAEAQQQQLAALEALRARQAAIREREMQSELDAEKREAELRSRRASTQARQLQHVLLQHRIEAESRRSTTGELSARSSMDGDPEAPFNLDFCEHCLPLYHKALMSPRVGSLLNIHSGAASKYTLSQASSPRHCSGLMSQASSPKLPLSQASSPRRTTFGPSN